MKNYLSVDNFCVAVTIMREDVVTLEATWRSEREDVDMALQECSKLKR